MKTPLRFAAAFWHVSARSCSDSDFGCGSDSARYDSDSDFGSCSGYSF